MLGAGCHAPPPGQVLCLETAHPGRRHLRAQVGVLPGALRHPAPARVPADIHHGRKIPVGAGRGGLGGNRSPDLLHQGRVPGAGQRQRDGEDRPVAVDHIVADQQGDPQPGFLYRHALVAPDLLRILDGENGADPALPHPGGQVRLPGQVQLHHLPDLFLQGHLV